MQDKNHECQGQTCWWSRLHSQNRPQNGGTHVYVPWMDTQFHEIVSADRRDLCRSGTTEKVVEEVYRARDVVVISKTQISYLYYISIDLWGVHIGIE